VTATTYDASGAIIDNVVIRALTRIAGGSAITTITRVDVNTTFGVNVEMKIKINSPVGLQASIGYFAIDIS
jgi:hypothetical protein